MSAVLIRWNIKLIKLSVFKLVKAKLLSFTDALASQWGNCLAAPWLSLITKFAHDAVVLIGRGKTLVHKQNQKYSLIILLAMW